MRYCICGTGTLKLKSVQNQHELCISPGLLRQSVLMTAVIMVMIINEDHIEKIAGGQLACIFVWPSLANYNAIYTMLIRSWCPLPFNELNRYTSRVCAPRMYITAIWYHLLPCHFYLCELLTIHHCSGRGARVEVTDFQPLKSLLVNRRQLYVIITQIATSVLKLFATNGHLNIKIGR